MGVWAANRVAAFSVFLRDESSKYPIEVMNRLQSTIDHAVQYVPQAETTVV